MSDRLGVLSWSFPMGRLFLTQIRVSPLFLVLGLILGYRLGWPLGLAFTGILFVSILLHELGHVLAARHTGGLADEILMWPLGGLAFAQPGPTLGSSLATSFGGPVVNLVLAGLFFPGWYAPDRLWGVLNPLVLPIASFQDGHLGRDLLLLGFSANWVLLLLNMLPVYPLDGGQVVLTLLQRRLPYELAIRLAANVGMLISFIVMSIGMMFELSWLVVIGSLVLVMNVFFATRIQMAEGYDDSFMGYDFSQGYTSLERGHRGTTRESRPSWYESWKARRLERKKLKDTTRRQNLERQLDELLAKVHEVGLEGLTESEKRLLRRASNELRHRSRPQDM